MPGSAWRPASKSSLNRRAECRVSGRIWVPRGLAWILAWPLTIQATVSGRLNPWTTLFLATSKRKLETARTL